MLILINPIRLILSDLITLTSCVMESKLWISLLRKLLQPPVIFFSCVQTLSSALTFTRNVISTRTNLFLRLPLKQYTRSGLLPTCDSLCDINKAHSVMLSVCFNHRGTGVWRGTIFYSFLSQHYNRGSIKLHTLGTELTKYPVIILEFGKILEHFSKCRRVLFYSNPI